MGSGRGSCPLIPSGAECDVPPIVKDSRQAIRFTANSRFKVLGNGKLRLPKVGDVPVRWSRDLPAARFFASFVVETSPAADAARFPAATAEVGIDLGLAHFAVLDDGTKISSPRFLRRAEKKLKKAQRDLSRKQEGSKNRDKARVKVARAHAHVRDARRDFHHKLSTAIIRDNQAVYVEDLAVNGLARTRLAKSVHDAGWSAFVNMLEYKAARYGRGFARVGRFEPTSQVCSACGVRDGPKPLHVREWTCRACGTVLDRDVNAAANIRRIGNQHVAAGRKPRAEMPGEAETQNACGGQVRPPAMAAQASEAGSHRSAA
jgi:putative transposase